MQEKLVKTCAASMPVPGITIRKTAVVCTSAHDDASITCHLHHIPDFVEAELERLYGSFFSSLPVLKLHGGLEDTHTYVLREGNAIRDIWLFQCDAHEVRVINEQIAIGETSLRRFAQYVFASYPSVNIITLHAVQAEVRGLRIPHHRTNCTEDSVLTLPASDEEYLTQLGKNTRKNIRRYLKRWEESFPSFRYQVYEGDEASEQDIRAIIELNRIRMAQKGKVSGNDEDEVRRILQLVKQRGVIGVGTIDGRVCAGVIAYRFGSHYFSQVRAHDPIYNDYRLGIIGAYLLIAACIARGGKELHFMWGREAHKSTLLAVQRDFDHVTLFRSPWQLLLHSPLIAKNAWSGFHRQAKLKVLEKARLNDDLPGQLANAAVAAMRRLKNFRQR